MTKRTSLTPSRSRRPSSTRISLSLKPRSMTSRTKTRSLRARSRTRLRLDRSGRVRIVSSKPASRSSKASLADYRSSTVTSTEKRRRLRTISICPSKRHLRWTRRCLRLRSSAIALTTIRLAWLRRRMTPFRRRKTPKAT